MSTPSPRTPDEITRLRQKARELELRIKADPAYLQQLQDDPLGTLRAAGFDDGTAPELAAELTWWTRRLPQGWEQTGRPFDHLYLYVYAICGYLTCIFTCSFGCPSGDSQIAAAVGANS
jgi:hypothetical protein